MAGINVLGKSAPKPGTLRPTDPNRFKTEDFFSVDAEADPEYIRRIVEVETLSARGQGCVLAKGGSAPRGYAFDRDDALYLRDEAEKARHRELELRDAEMGKFTRVRYKEDESAGGDDTNSPARKRAMPSRKVPVVKRQAAATATAAPYSPGHDRLTPERDAQDASAAEAGPSGYHAHESSMKSAEAQPSASDAATATALKAAPPAKPAGKPAAQHAKPVAGLGLAYSSDSDSESDDGD